MKTVSGLYFECKTEVFTNLSSIYVKIISQSTKLPTSEKRYFDKHIDTLLTFELKSLMSQRGLIFLMLSLFMPNRSILRLLSSQSPNSSDITSVSGLINSFSLLNTECFIHCIHRITVKANLKLSECFCWHRGYVTGRSHW